MAISGMIITNIKHFLTSKIPGKQKCTSLKVFKSKVKVHLECSRGSEHYFTLSFRKCSVLGDASLMMLVCYPGLLSYEIELPVSFSRRDTW